MPEAVIVDTLRTLTPTIWAAVRFCIVARTAYPVRVKYRNAQSPVSRIKLVIEARSWAVGMKNSPIRIASVLYAGSVLRTVPVKK